MLDGGICKARFDSLFHATGEACEIETHHERTSEHTRGRLVVSVTFFFMVIIGRPTDSGQDVIKLQKRGWKSRSKVGDLDRSDGDQ
jgi:hypothetical protein